MYAYSVVWKWVIHLASSLLFPFFPNYSLVYEVVKPERRPVVTYVEYGEDKLELFDAELLKNINEWWRSCENSWFGYSILILWFEEWKEYSTLPHPLWICSQFIICRYEQRMREETCLGLVRIEDEMGGLALSTPSRLNHTIVGQRDHLLVERVLHMKLKEIEDERREGKNDSDLPQPWGCGWPRLCTSDQLARGCSIQSRKSEWSSDQISIDGTWLYSLL